MNRIFNDMARVAGGMARVAGGMREEMEGWVAERIERVLEDAQLVRRQEFEAVSEMAAAARAEAELLAGRVAGLEQQLAARKPAASARPAAKRTGRTRKPAGTSGAASS